MTVSASYAPLEFSGNGSATEFGVTWPFFSGSLLVTLVAAGGAETVQAITTHYLVEGGTAVNGLPGTGTLTMLIAPATGETLRIERVTPKTQTATFTNNDAFPAKTVESALDRALLIGQETAYSVPDYDVFTSTVDGLVPASGGGTTTFLRADGTWSAGPQGPAGATGATGPTGPAGDTTAASAAAAAAAASAAAAAAAAEAAGITHFYDTKAAADAALAGLANLEVIEVLADESRGGFRTRYRKESGVYVFKLQLSSSAVFYVDSVVGSDSNDGLTPTSAKASLVAATALLSNGATLRIARGSRFFECWTGDSVSYIAVEAYGSGNRPIIDGTKEITGTWTADGSLWYNDVTLPEATTGSTADKASAWHIFVYDEAATGVYSRNDTARMTRIISGVSIAANKTSVTSTANSFTLHKTGSTVADPRNDNGTTFRVYIHARDGSNPNSNGRKVYITRQKTVAFLGYGWRISDIVFQRCGHKDMVNFGGASPVKADVIARCSFLDAGCHGVLAGGAEFRDCDAECAEDINDGNGGGGFHQFRDTVGVLTSRGFKIFNCRAKNFVYGIYSHGLDATAEHDTFDIDGFIAEDCVAAIAPGLTKRGIRARRISARNCNQVISYIVKEGVTIEDSEFFLTDFRASGGRVFIASTVETATPVALTLNNCLVTGINMLLQPPLSTIASSANFPTLILINSTLVGDSITDGGNAFWQQMNMNLTNAHVGKLYNGWGSDFWISGTVAADATSSIEATRSSQQDLLTLHAGVDSDVLTGTWRQVWEKTIALADLNFYSTSRVATYSGTPNGDGTADLTIDFNDLSGGRYIRVVDAYGSGSHYEGRVTSFGAGPGTPIKVTPAPISAFSSKVLHRGVLNHYVYRDAVTASISGDGTQLSVPDGAQFKVGMLIRVGSIVSGGASYGVRRITAKSSNVLTLDTACTWKNIKNNFTYKNIDGSGGGRDLPTVSVTWGFPLAMRTLSGDSTPGFSVALIEGGAALASLQTTSSTGTFDATATAITSYPALTPAGTDVTYNTMNPEAGYFSMGLYVAVGDVLTLTADADVSEHRIAFYADPDSSGLYVLDPKCAQAIRGTGYKGWR